jgi:DNA-binding NarL/FixJ family response regulator
MAVRCLIVDDNGSYLEAATALLERQGMTVVGVASTGDEAVRLTAQLVPDVVLVDITLGNESGFDLTRRLAETGPPPPPVILISTHAEADFTDLIDQTPVAGFVSKSQLSAGAIDLLLGSG